MGGGEAGQGGLQLGLHLGHQLGQEDVGPDAGHDGHALPGNLDIPEHTDNDWS